METKYTNFVVANASQGMILIVVLWILCLTSYWITHLLALIPLNKQLFSIWTQTSQQFEAAEAGLQYGEKLLAQKILRSSESIPEGYTLPPLSYAGYHVTVEAIRFPTVFCIFPLHHEGYYYQLTATAKHAQYLHKTPLRLQSYTALPGNKACNADLPGRQEGRTAWCQLG